jgi:hypothetical protein
MSIAKRIFDEAFGKPRDPRSNAYKDGVLRTLQMRLREFDGMSIAQYTLGTAECDAYFAGTDEGHRLASEWLAEESEREREFAHADREIQTSGF